MKTKKTNRYGNGLKKFGLCAFTAALISVNVCQPYIYPVYADDVQEESSAGQENTDIEERCTGWDRDDVHINGR